MHDRIYNLFVLVHFTKDQTVYKKYKQLRKKPLPVSLLENKTGITGQGTKVVGCSNDIGTHTGTVIIIIIFITKSSTIRMNTRVTRV